MNGATDGKVCPECGSADYEDLSWKDTKRGGLPYGRLCRKCGTRYMIPPSKAGAIRWFLYGSLFAGGAIASFAMVWLPARDGDWLTKKAYGMMGVALFLPLAAVCFKTGRSAFANQPVVRA